MGAGIRDPRDGRSAVLRRAGHRTGLYTSPHLVSFPERVQIDGAPVPEADLVAAAEKLAPFIESTGATFFEATTAIAFLCFAEAEVDVAVVEVGLGGRLDSTNVLSPMVSVVTNVALDHADLLGDTLLRMCFDSHEHQRSKGDRRATLHQAPNPTAPTVTNSTNVTNNGRIIHCAMHGSLPGHGWLELLGSIRPSFVGIRSIRHSHCCFTD